MICRSCLTIVILSLEVIFLLSAGCHAQTPAPTTTEIVKMEQPFLFAYGTWEKKAQITDGVAALDAPGMTPQGGAGVNQNLDLNGYGADCPGLRIQVGPHNTLKTLKLLLQDAAGHQGVWHFTLPAAGEGYQVVLPASGAALALADSVVKEKSPELGKITQWQLLGDWAGTGPVDVKVKGIFAVAPDAAITKQRQARADAEAAAREKSRLDRVAARTRYGTISAASPIIEKVYAAAPAVLTLSIHSGKITPSALTIYKPQPGDTPKPQDNGMTLTRGGEAIGYLIGPKHDGLVTFEGFTGDPLLTEEADDPANYSITSSDDPAFAGGIKPTSVSRKSKPDDWQQPKRPNFTLQHSVYLTLPHLLIPGRTYKVTLTNINVQKRGVTLAFDPGSVWTESIHVNQIGFRPDDPRKEAFLSVWAGGVMHFPDGLKFHLAESTSGKRVFAGTVGSPWAADKVEKMYSERNFNGTDVSPMDFSSFKTPGNYKLVVDGIGCSYPFEIGPIVWKKAFLVQMKGFFNQRSGVALGPPYTPFVRPADFHPGVPGTVSITQSTYSQLDGGDAQKDLAKGDTGVAVPGAWGGYHDAGDWNPRRITHMRTTTFWQLQLLELFPDYFRTVPLNIPKTAAVPDLLSECLFELSLFHRLQSADGGVSYGIETNGDPLDGEVSWKQSMSAYVYAPDVQSSYLYAGIAARAARVLAPYNPTAAKMYRESALRAMLWAENDRTRRQAAGSWATLPKDVAEDRTLASVEVYALTGDRHWAEIFKSASELTSETSTPFYGSLARRDAAFAYALLPAKLSEPTIKSHALRALIADADGALAYQRGNAWGIASDDPGKPLFLGFYSTPHGAVSLIRAYHLTHDPKYLAGAIGTSQFSGGANPNNLVYTTGLGANPVKHILNLDSRFTGQPVPAGLTPYGNVDLTRWGDQTWITWPITYFFGKLSQPAPAEWPTSEAYFDVFFMPGENEFTMDQTMGYNAYVWGYLAARP